MADQVLTKQKLINGDQDLSDLEEVLSGPPGKLVKTRLGREVYTLASVPQINTMTREEVTSALAPKADKAETAAALDTKANHADTFLKTEVAGLVAPKADKTYVDTALAGFTNGASKFYPALAEANADIANIKPNAANPTVKDKVDIGEIANGGTWYKATTGATTLTKSPYDPLAQAKADATTKVNTAKNEAVLLASEGTENQIKSVISEGDESILSVVDKDSNIALQVKRDEIDLPDLKIQETEVDDFQVVDKHGNIAFSAKQTNNDISTLKTLVEGLSGNGESTPLIQDFLEKQALAYASSVNNTYVTEVQKPVFDYNIVITYGQSLSTANEGYPALSKTPIEQANVLMFGDSVRSLDRLAANWRPVGGAALKGLKATVQQRDVADSVIMTDAQVAALAAGSQHEGESFDVGAVNFWRMLQNDYFGVSVNPNKKIVVLNCGVAGQSIEALSKGASSGFYNRISIAVNQLKNHIQSIDPSATLGVVAILHAQGEYNYNGTGSRDKTTFLNLTKQLRQDIIDDVAIGIFNQSKPPAFITYQTAGSWSVDSTELSIGNAQLEMSETVPGCWIATPSYHITDKGGHLDCNGYRWMGMHFGHVLHRILDRGIQWKPLKPLSVIGLDKDIYVNFHVPKPPLQFKTVYESLIARNYSNKGFRITNGGVEVPIVSVEIIGQCTIKISTNQKITSGMKLWYAPKTSCNGNGNLCDSDQTIAPFNYEYHENSGQYSSANITELVGKPYPLNNFCVAFVRSVEV